MKHIEYRSHHQFTIGHDESEKLEFEIVSTDRFRPQLGLSAIASSGRSVNDANRLYEMVRSGITKSISGQQQPVQLTIKLNVLVNTKPETKSYDISNSIFTSFDSKIILFDLVPAGSTSSITAQLANGDTVVLADGLNCTLFIITSQLRKVQISDIVLTLKKNKGLIYT